MPSSGPRPSEQKKTAKQQLWEQLSANQQLAQKAVATMNKQMRKKLREVRQQQQPIPKKENA